MQALNILVIDDEQSICLLLHDVLTRFGHKVMTCQDAADGLTTASENSFDLVFCDIRMPGMNGLDALKQLREIHPNCTFVMITGYAKDDIIEEALHSGASACLSKPFSLSNVIKVLDQLAAAQPVSV